MPNIDFISVPRHAPVTVALALALAGCGPGRTTFATYPSAAPTFDRAAADPKAVEIADRVITASGGQDKWAAAKQIQWSESITAADGELTFDQAWDRWNGRHYQRLHTKAVDVVVMRNLYDTRGTAFAESGRQRQSLGKEETERALAAARERWSFDTTLLCLPFLLEAPGGKLELTGELKPDGADAPLDVLKLTFDSKDPTRTASYYAMVNRTTNQIERVEIVKAGDPDTKRIAYKVGTVIDAAGLRLATVYNNIGVPSEVITFSKIIIASDPDDTLYVPVTQ